MLQLKRSFWVDAAVLSKILNLLDDMFVLISPLKQFEPEDCVPDALMGVSAVSVTFNLDQFQILALK